MEFKEYLAIIRRRWLLFFPIFALIVGAHLIWVSYSQKDRFTATSKIILGAEQSASPAAPMIPNPVGSLSAITKEATLTHRPVLARAAQLALGEVEFVSPEFAEPKFQNAITQGQQAIREAFGQGEEARQRIVDFLQNRILVETNRDRQIAEIGVEASSEATALILSWAVAEGAHQFHNEKAQEHVREYIANLDVKIAEAQTDLVAASSELNEIRRRTNIEDFDEKERLLQEFIYQYVNKDHELEIQARTNDREIQARLQQQSWDQRIDIQEAKLITSGRLEKIRDQLFESQLDYETKIATLSPEHPDMIQIRNRIVGLESKFADEQSTLLKERFERFSENTNDLINNNAKIQLTREVYAEARNRMTGELRQLQELRQEFSPRESTYEDAKQRLANLRETEKNVRWYADSRLGTVVVYDPADQALPVMRRGGGLGPLTLTILMAFIFALGVVYVVEYVDTRVKNEHDIRRHLNLPLLGVIPKENEYDRLLTEAPLQSEISEKFNTAATLLQSVSGDLGLRSVMVCSAIAREGKTTVSVNLAVALARKGAKTVLIDGDLRISQVHNCLRVPNHVGLSTILDSRVNPHQVIEGVLTEDQLDGRRVNPLSVVQHTSVENLDVIPAGPTVPDPVVLLEPNRLQALVKELKNHYDFVIFDTPPINKVGDALTISSAVEGTVFVVGAGQAEQHEVTWAKHLLTNVQANILGVFLNKFSKQRGGEYYYYYYYNDKKRKRIKSRA